MPEGTKIIGTDDRIATLESKVKVLEGLVNQLDNIILKNPGFFPIGGKAE